MNVILIQGRERIKERTKARAATTKHKARFVVQYKTELIISQDRRKVYRFSFLSSSSSSFWRRDSFAGVCTRTFTSKSPLPNPETLGIPFPPSLMTLSDWMPAGTFKDTVSYSVLMSILSPNAACENRTGRSRYRSLPLREKIGCLATVTATYKSPLCAPSGAAFPLPCTLNICSESMPAGIFILNVSVSLRTPAPWHWVHLCLGTLPLP